MGHIANLDAINTFLHYLISLFTAYYIIISNEINKINVRSVSLYKSRFTGCKQLLLCKGVIINSWSGMLFCYYLAGIKNPIVTVSVFIPRDFPVISHSVINNLGIGEEFYLLADIFIDHLL